MSFWDLLFHGEEYIQKIVKKQVAEQTADLTQQIQVLQQTVQTQNRQIQTLEQQLQKREQGQAAKSVRTPPEPRAGEKEEYPALLTITDFAISPSSRILIRKKADIQPALENLQNTQPMQQVLQQYKTEEAAMLGRMLEQYLQKIKRFAAKLPVQQKKWDEELLSEEVTNKIFSLLQKNLFSVLPVTIQRGYAAKPEFYSRLLAAFNQYLKQCGVYTHQPASKTQLAEEDYDWMQIQPLPAKTQADNGRVASIERLPYCLDYMDEDGERQTYQFDGQMYVYRYDA